MATNEEILKFMKDISIPQGVETPTASGASSSGDLAESEDSSASEEAYETYAQVCRKGKRPRRRANHTISI